MSDDCFDNGIRDSLDIKLMSIYDHANDFNYGKNVVCYQCRTFMNPRLVCPMMQFRQTGECPEPRKACWYKRESPGEVKTPILGNHLRMSNDGYARQIECGMRFVG